MENPSLSETVMSAQPAIERTVVLHVGMHKTASTYIQKRLRKNRGLLRRHGLLMPARRRQDRVLLDALANGRWKPWRRWLNRAETRGCHLLVSHEALSWSLSRTVNLKSQPRGLWLAEKLQAHGWQLKVVGFIRDQESYLNSRYTQLVKRLTVHGDFKSYVSRVITESTISECDLMTLFGWLVDHVSVETVMIPFGSALDCHGRSIQTRPDPYEQLLAELPLPAKVAKQSRPARSKNQQPGRLGVALARAIGTHLTEQNPKILRKHDKALRAAIETLARQQGWPDHPFNGLNTEIRETIRERYAHSNADFCRCFWPFVQWDDLFPAETENVPPAIASDQQQEETRQLTALRDRLIADTVNCC